MDRTISGYPPQQKKSELREFELYDKLKSDVMKDGYPPVDMCEVCRKVHSLTMHGKDKVMSIYVTIAALIYHHSLLLGHSSSENVPPLYGQLCSGGKGITYHFDPNNVQAGPDPIIQAVIARYIEQITF